MTRALRSAGCVFLLVGISGCGKSPSKAECEELLDHYTELLIRSDRPKTNVTDRDKLKAETRAKAARDPAFSTCSKDVSRSAFECAMQAGDVDSVERCLQ